MRTRRQHIAWARRRALKYLDAGDIARAILSMHADLTLHNDTKPTVDDALASFRIVGNDDAAMARQWIEGFQ